MADGADAVESYLDELPDDRRAAIGRVREVIRANLPSGYVEVMGGSMISYEIPLEVYPETYNKKPLLYAALASQKRHMALYLTSVYSDPHELTWFTEAYRESGRPMDMGKSCVRFTALEDLPLEVVGQAIARTSVAEFIASYEATRGASS